LAETVNLAQRVITSGSGPAGPESPMYGAPMVVKQHLALQLDGTNLKSLFRLVAEMTVGKKYGPDPTHQKW